jgi:butyrate kinase
MASRTANSLAACVTRFQKEAEMKDALMQRLFEDEGYSLAEIQAVLKRGGLHMARSGIRGVLVRRGVDTSRNDLAS